MIETERLTLRNWRLADVEPFILHTNTEPVMRWLGGVKSAEEMRALVVDRQIVRQETLGFTFWAVERKQDGALLGFCGIKLADPVNLPVEGQHEIGWRLRQDAWGQGYAKEAASVSLDFAFGSLAAPHVVALTCIQNRPSWGLMERLGMTRRAELDHDDPRYPDLNPTIVYRIDKAEWRR